MPRSRRSLARAFQRPRGAFRVPVAALVPCGVRRCACPARRAGPRVPRVAALASSLWPARWRWPPGARAGAGRRARAGGSSACRVRPPCRAWFGCVARRRASARVACRSARSPPGRRPGRGGRGGGASAGAVPCGWPWLARGRRRGAALFAGVSPARLGCAGVGALAAVSLFGPLRGVAGGLPLPAWRSGPRVRDASAGGGRPPGPPGGGPAGARRGRPRPVAGARPWPPARPPAARGPPGGRCPPPRRRRLGAPLAGAAPRRRPGAGLRLALWAWFWRAAAASRVVARPGPIAPPSGRSRGTSTAGSSICGPSGVAAAPGAVFAGPARPVLPRLCRPRVSAWRRPGAAAHWAARSSARRLRGPAPAGCGGLRRLRFGDWFAGQRLSSPAAGSPGLLRRPAARALCGRPRPASAWRRPGPAAACARPRAVGARVPASARRASAPRCSRGSPRACGSPPSTHGRRSTRFARPDRSRQSHLRPRDRCRSPERG